MHANSVVCLVLCVAVESEAITHHGSLLRSPHIPLSVCRTFRSFEFEILFSLSLSLSLSLSII